MISRYFFKLNRYNIPIERSNIKRISKPIGKWKEIKKCNSIIDTVPYMKIYKYFIQIDHLGNPIDSTLIRRLKRPENNGLRFIEIHLEECI